MTTLEGKRIFVVEDDPTNMAVMAVLLRKSGALIIQDPWGYNTIERLVNTLPIDVILVDLMLRQGINGYDIFDQIKAQPELASIPVVMVSAADPSVEMNTARTKGFMGYIEKPIEYHRFSNQIASVIEGTPIWLD